MAYLDQSYGENMYFINKKDKKINVEKIPIIQTNDSILDKCYKAIIEMKINNYKPND